MKAAVIRQCGDVGQVVIEQLPTPSPARGEVLLAVRAAALNHLDIWVRNGGRFELTMPHVLGSDAAGVVTKLGPGVSGVAVGDEVVLDSGLSCGACEYCRRGEKSLCPDFGIIGAHRDGTFAEFIAVPAANVLPKPAILDFAHAAALGVAHVTAWRMLMTRCRLQPGQTVLIHGIGGGVAVAALQLVVLAGAEAIVTSSSDDKLRRAVELGAAHAINYRATDDVAASVREITGGRGVDIAFDAVGAATWPINFAAVRRGGVIVHCGVTTGATVEANISELYWNQLTVMGSTYGSREDMRRMLRAVQVGRLTPVIDSTHPLDDARAAQAKMEAGRQFGKIVLTMDS